MTQPPQDQSELPENEKRSSEPAPVIVQEDKRRYLYEGALIVLSVLLALFLNEVRNSWQESQRTREIIENLRNELTKNKATVKEHYNYITTVLHNVDSARTSDSYRSELFKDDIFLFGGIASDGVFNYGFIDEVAWEIARNNNIYSKIDFETVSLLTEIYRQQAFVNKGYEDVWEVVKTRESLDPEKSLETLNLISLAYRGYSYDRMPQLIRFYDEALEKLGVY